MDSIEVSKAEQLVSRKPVRPIVECPIWLGENWFDEIIPFLKDMVGDHMAALIVDQRVAELYADRLDLLHAALPRVRQLELNPRSAKTLKTYGEIVDFLLEHDMHHDDFLVSIGGGSILDIAGFAAATYTRGLNWISLPTTLIAQVDCGIGGKTALDVGSHKNYLGTFYTPEVLLVDLSFLKTLPDNHYRAAIPEMVKMALINNEPLYKQLAETTADGRGLEGIRSRELDLARAVIQCKAEIIETDPYQRKTRVSLLTGHTTAHALESASNLNLPHGDAVAIGLAFESWIAEKRQLISPEDRRLLVDTLENCGLRIQLPGELQDPVLIDCMRREKRNRGRSVGMVLPYKPGMAIADWPAPYVQLSLEEVWNELVSFRRAFG
jgi:3-dehydroquinate synthetase